MKTFRQIALERAIHYIGVHEDPPNSNRGELIDKWLRAAGVKPGNPWCMAFLRAMFKEAGYPLGGGASVGLFEQWARAKGYLVKVPRPGDIACYDWNSDHWPDHVGIVHHVALKPGAIHHFDGSREPVQKGDVICVEGNTAIGNDSDGGRVMFRARRQRVCKFARIPGRPV